MLQSARKNLPAIDYVSIVRSVFKDRVAMLLGTTASAAAAVAGGIHSQSLILFVHALLFLTIALIRFREAVAFDRARIGPEDAEEAERWEARATISGCLIGLNYGMWCFSSLVLVNDTFAELTSITVTIAALVGTMTRNFGLDRIVTLQLILVGVPLCSGLLLEGDIYHGMLALLFAPMMVSFRTLAGDVREMLLAAVHDRVRSSRLAAELDTAVSTMSHGLCLLDRNLKVSVANEQACEMLLGRGQNCVGRNFLEVIDMAERKHKLTRLSAERLQTALADRGNCKLVLQMSDGTQSEVSISSSADQIALVFEDITDRVAAENKIRYLARYDDLTGLPNRRHLVEQFEARLAGLHESGTTSPVVLMIVDFDDFKAVNDTLGHPAGDEVLRKLSARMRQNLDSQVLLGRFGGDEFVIFSDQDVSRSAAEGIAARILRVLREPVPLDGEQVELNASIGIVIEHASRADAKTLLKRADLALYAAKGAGKNQWAQFDPQMDQDYSDRQLLKSALRDAIRGGQLGLAFQPLVDVRSRKVVGCEALARWHHPEFGVIPPGIFIPIAEEIGVISELTEWVLGAAVSECAQWPEDVVVSVNVSARDFRGDAVVSMVRNALNKSGLRPERLEIEVTETVFMEELENAARALGELRALGVGIALDDFGTGYSSLAYVHEMPFTKVKIDRSFAVDVTNDKRALVLMKNIALMSKELDMLVTVEGIETEEQMSVVAGLGLIDQVQGFLFGAPVPQSEIGRLVDSVSGKRLEPQSHTG